MVSVQGEGKCCSRKEFLLDLAMTVKFAHQLLVADSLRQQWHLKRELLKQLLLLPPTNVSSITCFEFVDEVSSCSEIFSQGSIQDSFPSSSV